MIKFTHQRLLVAGLTAALISGQNVQAQETTVDEISDYVFDKLPQQILEKFPESLIDELKTKSDFGATLEVGGFTSDNLSVTDIDVSSERHDIAAKASILVSYDQGLGENLNLGVSYKGSQTLYEDFTNFDFQSHLFTAKADYKIKGYKVGVIYRNVDSTLSGEEFLKLGQISPYVSKFVGKKTFIRAAYSLSDKTFETIESRNAKEHQGRLDAYYFLDGTRQYVIIGYALEHSNAEDDPFDYVSNRLKFRYAQRVSLGRRKLKLGASWIYEARDYENITPSIDSVRADKRNRGKIDIEVPINKSLYSRVEYQRELNSSNLPAADFNRNTVTFTLGLKL